ncbi:MAG: hypothetical protein WCP21_23715, partial [Armatimonadota bacterium]
MTYQQRVRALSIILLACLWGGAALADQYEVRTFLVPAVATPSFQFGQSCIKGRYMCPECGFSCDIRPADGNCPHPFGGHAGGVALQDMGTRLRERLLSLAPGTMPAGQIDLELPTAAGAVTGRAVLGRPFAPTDNGNARRSTVYAQAAGLVNANAANGPIISAAMHGRFLVVPPTPLRREAATTDGSTTTYNFAGRKISARVEDVLH